MEAKEMNPVVLAYIGDGVYEVYVRNKLIKEHAKVDQMQKASIQYVGAKGQCQKLLHLMEENFFTEEEVAIIKRGRNNKSGRRPKNVDIITYKHATAFECLIGTLYLNREIKRMEDIIDRMLEGE